MLATRHRDDPEPEWTPLPGLSTLRETDPIALATLQGKSEAEIVRRFEHGHRAYVAFWKGAPAGWGWVATRIAEIGELGATLVVPPDHRYLWNFVTLPSYRGMGVYPRLLDAIVRSESAEAERFWIAYAPENHASGSGIRKAGFVTLAELSFDPDGRPAVKERIPGGGTAAARLLGLPEMERTLAPCWRCARRGAQSRCSAGGCTCDYQRAEAGCAR